MRFDITVCNKQYVRYIVSAATREEAEEQAKTYFNKGKVGESYSANLQVEAVTELGNV